MSNGLIFDIQRFCLHDGDGIRTTVFLKGCALHCMWCHNPESQSMKPELMFYEFKCQHCRKCLNLCDSRAWVDNKIVIDRAACKRCGKCVKACNSDANKICGYTVAASDIIKTVLKDKIFYLNSNGGMTISGGEPAFQPEFSLKLIELAQQASINSAIETCGYGKRDFFEAVNKLKATFLFDIKTLDAEKHKKLTGVSNVLILSNLEFLLANNADVIIRLPMIPGVNDSDDEIRSLAEFLSDRKTSFRYAEIMPYHSLGISKEKSLSRQSDLPPIVEGSEMVPAWEKKLNQYGYSEFLQNRGML